MRLKDEQAWNTAVLVNQDRYNMAVLEFAEHWAGLMEAAMSEHGRDVHQVARASARKAARSVSVSPHQYGCAVNILASLWVHGEELRLWHNIRTQIADEGIVANQKKGTVLNASES